MQSEFKSFLWELIIGFGIIGAIVLLVLMLLMLGCIVAKKYRTQQESKKIDAFFTHIEEFRNDFA